MKTQNDQTDREILADIWWAGTKAVRGYESVTADLTAHQSAKPDHIISVGKAAASMAKAAIDHFGSRIPTLVITKYDHSDDGLDRDHIEMIEAAHPVPDAKSLEAGKALLDRVKSIDPEERLLFLASGGASALVEVPTGDLKLADIISRNKDLLSSGRDIHAMNQERRKWSEIKGGRLFEQFGGESALTLAVSDVEGDDIMVIGSGIGASSHPTRIVASNAIARSAAENAAKVLGLEVLQNTETLYGDVDHIAKSMATELADGTPGVRIWGGETTTLLPDSPGRGGRNQALALALSREIDKLPDLQVLVAGTDGTDGPTEDAGGFASGNLWTDHAADGLKRADSGTFLDEHGLLFRTGPTGTNVMDLAISIQR